jgi:ferritin
MISGIYEIAQNLKLFDEVKSKLIQQPDPAAKYLTEVLQELAKTYQAIDEEISNYLGIWFDSNDLTNLREQRHTLISLEGGKVSVRMAEARGHCSKIKSIFERFLDTWFKRIFDKDEYNNVDNLFKNLYHWDNFLIQTLDSLADWLQTNASDVLSHISKQDFNQANDKINQDRTSILQDRRDLSEIMKILYELQASLIETSKALPS